VLSNLSIRLGVTGALLTGAAGLALLTLPAAAPALAGSCTSPNGGVACTPGVPVTATASVATVASSTTLTMTSTSVAFPTATTLPATEPASTAVTGTVASNDTSGWSVDVESVSTPGATGAACGDFVGNLNAAPSGGIDDYINVTDNLQVTSATGGSGFLTSVTSPCGLETSNPTDKGTGDGTISDNYVLVIPASTEADTYTTTFDYIIIGN
jgi:hypothetical protein